MKFITPRNRIAMGLTGAVVAVVCLARIAGYIPDEQAQTMFARRDIAETIALGSSALLVGNDSAALESFLEGVAERNSDLQSVGIRKADGQLAAHFGEHEGQWTETNSEESSASQMRVPLYRTGDQKWGTIELRFTDRIGSGLIGMLRSMGAEQMFFIASSCFLLFSLVLRLVLKHLDPSKAVPQRVRDALDNLAEGLMIVDTRFNILLANTALANVVGVEASTLVGKSAKKLKFLCGEENESDAFPWKTALNEKRPVSNTRVRLIDADDNERTYLVNCSPLLGHQGNYCGVMVTFDDVTQLEESRIQLAEARDAADAANQAKSDFLANMSHEIRTPMNAILGFTDVLRRGMEENPDQRIEYLNTIHTSGNHLIELINDILDLSKVEAGRLDLEQREFSPPELLDQTITVLSARAREKQLEFGYEVQGQIPATATSDSTRIKQILINLIGNAIKFTEQGSVKLNASWKDNALQLDIEDTGIGMTPEQLEKVFDPFSQADSSVTRRFGGTGLGLSICKRFAEALGGSISVQSEHGSGSVFTVLLPMTVDSGVSMLDHEQCLEHVRHNHKVEAGGERMRLNPATILVVDDGETNRNLVSVVLRRHGLNIVEAENGSIAIDQAAAHEPHVILMDMQMPVMDGYTATRTLRESGSQIPIVALTGNAMQGDQQKCIDAGCDGFLPKPIEIDALIEVLGSHIGFSDQPLSTGDTTAERGIESPPLESVESPTDSALSPAPSSQDDLNLTDQDQGQLGGDVARGSVEKWTSTLPMDDPEFRRIVEKFLSTLPEKLNEMIELLEAGELVELRDRAHWLKGAGGTVGLGRITPLALELEKASKAENLALCHETLLQIVDLAEAIDLDANCEAAISG